MEGMGELGYAIQNDPHERVVLQNKSKLLCWHYVSSGEIDIFLKLRYAILIMVHPCLFHILREIFF